MNNICQQHERVDVPPADDHADELTQAELDAAASFASSAGISKKEKPKMSENEATAKKRPAKAKKPAATNAPKCLVPDCGRLVMTRGLCQACYSVARHLVNDGKTTWEALEVAGKVLPRNGRAGTLRAKAKAFMLG